MPSMITEADIVFEELVQEFPAEIAEMAREFKAFVRARKIKSVSQLLRIVLLYCGLDKSLREVAANITMTVEQISDTAITKRLLSTQAWIKAMLPKMLNIPKFDQFNQRRLIVVDGSCIQGPGAKTTQYRIHIALNLFTLEIVELIVSDKHMAESLVNYHTEVGDIIIADRGYGRSKQDIINMDKRQTQLLLRYHSLLPLLEPDNNDKSIDIVKQLTGKARKGSVSKAIAIKHNDEVVDGWLHAFRLPAEAVARARRKIKAEAKKKHRTTRASTLFLAGWLVIITTLPITEFSAQTIGQLYRCRWQVEVAIKRFKSVLDIDLLRAHEGSPLAQVWLTGKMLYVLLIEHRGRRKAKDSVALLWLDQNRLLTEWRLFKLVIDQITPLITLAQFWPKEFSPALIRVLAERPRRRKLQSLPLPLALALALNQIPLPLSA